MSEDTITLLWPVDSWAKKEEMISGPGEAKSVQGEDAASGDYLYNGNFIVKRNFFENSDE